MTITIDPIAASFVGVAVFVTIIYGFILAWQRGRLHGLNEALGVVRNAMNKADIKPEEVNAQGN